MSEQERKENYFGKGKSKIKWVNIPEVEWDWENFHSTEGFPLSTKLLDWVIGQDKAMKECYLCLDEWVHKLKNLDKDNWWKDWEKPENSKPAIKKKLSPGPYLFLLGDPGTGKSLIGRALAEKLTDLYKEHKVKMYDVLSWKNSIIPSEPRISIHPSPKGKEMVTKERQKVQQQLWKKSLGISSVKWLCVGLGILLLFCALYTILMPWATNQMIVSGGAYVPIQTAFAGNFFQYFMAELPGIAFLLMAGGSLLFSSIFISYLFKFLGSQGGMKGISGSENTDAPKMLIDNSQQIAQFIDATGHGSSQLFGSIAWDPYQTGGLGCYDEQTRLFTPTGFKRYSEIQLGDIVYSLNNEEELELVKVTKILIAPYHNKMIHFKTQAIDLLVTPDHKMFYKRPDQFEGLRIRDAQNLPLKSYLPVSARTLLRNSQLDCKRRFVTSDPVVRNEYINVLLRLGYPITLNYDEKHKTWLIQYSKNRKGYLYHGTRNLVDYDGLVWCVHVERNHNVLVERNGKFVFCGNTPEHQRVSAGDVHRANLGILYIDELKNLQPAEAITLLTVLEDGQLPIALRSQFHGGDTSAMAVATEPLPCVTFLVGAGNFDSINQIHPALMDRIYGYGKVVRMNNDFPNTGESRRKYVQFISQEVDRFNLLPFTRSACIEVIEEARRRSNRRETLTAKFRPLISILKTASVLTMNAGEKEVSEDRVKEAIKDHCKTIQKQILEHMIQEESKFSEITPSGKKLGTIYGLAVSSDPVSGESIGSVIRIKAQMIKAKKDCGYFKVTGVPKNAVYMPGSIAKVRSVILKKYGVDVAHDYCTHIDFSQEYAVDGPSAGVTMTLALCSLLEKKPIRQDVAVTGEINISSDDEMEITAVGGLYEKIKAAESWNFKEVVIPDKNYQHSIEPTDFKVVVRPGKTLNEYLKVLLS